MLQNIINNHIIIINHIIINNHIIIIHLAEIKKLFSEN